LSYQHEYQQFEADKIAASADIRDEHFFDEFNKTHPAIASPSGPEEWFAYQTTNFWSTILRILGGALLCSGIIAVLVAYLLYHRARAKVLGLPNQYDESSIRRLMQEYENSKQQQSTSLPKDSDNN
jgi:hypothetical protein